LRIVTICSRRSPNAKYLQKQFANINAIFHGVVEDLSDLDQILDTRQRLIAFPEYQTPGFVEEVSGLYDQPLWSLLIRPCMGHIHRHLGELEVVKNISRAQV
jgi:hypothetical protein